MSIPKLPLFLIYPFLISVWTAAQPIDRSYMYSDGDAVELTPEARLKIEQALPQSPSVTPIHKRKILVFNLHIKNGERVRGHKSIPYTNYALHRMSETTGAFELHFSENVEDLSRDVLDHYDAVAFVNTGGVLTEDKQLQKDLLDYLFEGGGFLGLHAAGATFCQWPKYDYFPEYGEMLGGWENGGHPWRPDESFVVAIEEPDHPLNESFNGEDFEISDEVFQFDDPYSRNRQRILVKVHPTLSNWDPSRHILQKRLKDKDVALSWIKRYGRGRVFYTSFGHNEHTAWNPKLLKHYLDAIQYVVGDLPAPEIPSAKLTPAIRAQEELGWRFGIEAYTFRDNTFFETIEYTDQLGLAYVGGLNVQKVSKEIDKFLDHHLSDAEIQQVRSKLTAHGIIPLTYFVFDLPGDESECRKIFEFGKKLGVETFISEPKIEDLDLVEKLAIEFNIKVAIHNHGPRLSPVYMYPEKIRELTEHRNPLIGAACDFGHWAKEGIDPYEAVQILGDRIITMQMHDQSSIDSEGHDVPWGTGVVNLVGILDYLKTNNIHPVMFGLEYSYNWGSSLPEVEASISYFNQETLKQSPHHD